MSVPLKRKRKGFGVEDTPLKSMPSMLRTKSFTPNKPLLSAAKSGTM
jgi:hypothetical protein